MREKVFHGTNSIPCANIVLPTFMRYSRSLNPESIANEPQEIQIVDTLKLLSPLLANGLDGEAPKLIRTAARIYDDQILAHCAIWENSGMHRFSI